MPRWMVPLTAMFGLIAGCAAAQREQAGALQRDPRWQHDEGGIVRGDAAEKRLALIFTGGDYGEGTEHILNVLHRRGIKASFFVPGQYRAKAEHRPLVTRIVAEGHYLGPHSDGHLLYCAWEDRARTLVTQDAFRQDLRENIADLRSFGALRSDGPIYFIPPYEWFNAEQVRWANAMGLVLFNFTPGSGSNRDWIPEGERGFVSSEEILRGILEYERRDLHGLNGFLLLLHVGSLRTDKMHMQLEPLVGELMQRGYVFVRVDDLLRPRPISRDGTR